MDKRSIVELMMPLIRISAFRENIQLEKEKYSRDNIREIIGFARREAIAHIIVDGLQKGKVLKKDSQMMEELKQYILVTFAMYVRKDSDIEEMKHALNSIPIPYICLKGARVRKFYPEPWMRTSCDVDILIHESDLSKAISKFERDLGYRIHSQDYHDVSMLSPGNTHLELHFNIRENANALDSILDTVWDHSYPVNEQESSEFLQTNEFFVFYHVAHMSHHFLEGGCGIRPFIDLHLIKKQMKVDENKVRNFMNEAGILSFYEAVLNLNAVWFEGKEHSEITKLMEEYLIDNDAKGRQDNQLAVGKCIKNSQFRNVRSRIFVPRSILKATYPVLEHHKFLLPFCQIHRACKKLPWKRIRDFLHYKEKQENVDEIKCRKVSEMLDKLELLSIVDK